MVHWFMLCRKVKSDCDRKEFLENSAKYKLMMSNGPSTVIVQAISNTYKQIWRISEVEQINMFEKKKKKQLTKSLQWNTYWWSYKEQQLKNIIF